ncbi:Rieske (2Fe-2S) protein [Bacillus salipaludis]|uniref:Rieske (2Fe-2S) protein n=1 Tax=Bacillus salipaludis TaxID=2547811 RepID=A0ABW8RRB3_9BACI
MGRGIFGLNECPHQGIPMIFGSITGTMVTSNPQEYEYGLNNEIITCPLHGWEFELKTGKSLFSPDQVSLLTYDIRKEEEEIVLYLKRKPENISINDFQCSPLCK